MSCQTFMKSLKFICNYRQILSHVNYASMYSLQNFKNCVNSQFLSAAYFGTSINRCSDEPTVTDDTELYYFEANRRLAKHVDDPDMPKVKLTLINKDKKEIQIEANVGMTVLKAALKSNVPIDSACEGKKACTTCHCYIDADMTSYFTLSDVDEDDLLDVAPFGRPTSRLSCQMKIIKPFENARIYLPQATLNFAVDKEAKKQN